MQKKQILFCILALIYGLIHLIMLVSGEFLSPVSAIIPGWHVEIGYTNIYQKPFTVIYFFLIGLVYGAHPFKNIPGFIFWFHFICSIIPAISIILWPKLFSTSFNNIEDLDLEFQYSFYIEQFFLYSQLIFIFYFFYFQLRNRNSYQDNLKNT